MTDESMTECDVCDAETEFYSLAGVLFNSLAMCSTASPALMLAILRLLRRMLAILILNSLAILLEGVLLILPRWRILLSLAIFMLLSQQSDPTLLRVLHSFFLAGLGLGLLIFNWRSGLAILCGMLMLLSHSPPLSAA